MTGFVQVPRLRYAHRKSSTRRAHGWAWEVLDLIDNSIADRCHTEAKAIEIAGAWQTSWEAKIANSPAAT